MKLARTVLVLATLLTIIPAGSALADDHDDDWAFDGGGWGHGVGLSQYGAYGMAKNDGASADDILTHYYTGVAIEEFTATTWIFDAEALWVGLEQSVNSVTLQAIGGPSTVCQLKDGACETTFDMQPEEVWVFETNPDSTALQCRFRRQDPPADPTGYGTCDADLSWIDDGGGTRLKVNSREYAHGTLRLRPETVDPIDSFHAVLSIGLENYLYGLGEMPSSWGKYGQEALKAQAIIGRGYGIATALARGDADGSGRLSSCGCHLRDDSRDQVYAGWSKENETVNGTNYGQTYWRPAVDSTTGLVVTHPESTAPGHIISAHYSSSTGGATENVEDVWGSANAWERSVPDPWGADPNHNPLARWTVYVDESNLAAALGWDEVISAKTLAGPPGTVIEFTGRDGGSLVTVNKSGTQVRAIMGLYGFRADGETVRTSPYIISVAAPGPPFTDISGSTHEADIVDIWRRDITKGCNPPDNTLYCPDQAVTRGQMAAFLVRALGVPSTGEDFFADDDGTTFENDINKLAAAGITRGCNPPGNTRYCPTDPVTRGQMAAFLHRAFDELLTPGAAVEFIDDNGSTFESDIEWLGATGVTKGCNPPTNDRYCPNDRVTRAQMASFLARALRMAES